MKTTFKAFKMQLLVNLLISNALFAQCGSGNTIPVTNPSFEGLTGTHIAPDPWNTCGITPDTQPGSWGVSQSPSEGNSYLGLVFGGPNWQEGVSQQLTEPILSGTNYIFTVDLSASDAIDGGLDSSSHGVLEIWGGNTLCTKTELLWSSPLITEVGWETYLVSFVPSSTYEYIYFLNNGQQMGYLLVDNISSVGDPTETINILSHADSSSEDCSFFFSGWADPTYVDSVVVSGNFTGSSLTANFIDSTWSINLNFTESGYQSITAVAYFTDNQNNPSICSVEQITLEIESPTAVIEANSGCSNLPILLFDASIVGGTNQITDWDWDFGDGQGSNQQNPTHQYESSGSYDVSLTITSSDGCSADTFMELTVLPIPAADFTFSEVCLGYSTNFHDFSIPFGGPIVLWDWDFGDGNFSNSEDPVHIYSTADSFNVVLSVTDVNGCMDTLSQWVDVFVCNANSLDDLSGQPQIEFYPNPSSSVATLESAEAMEEIMLFDNSGKLVFNVSGISSCREVLNFSSIAAGSYLARVIFENSNSTDFRVSVVK